MNDVDSARWLDPDVLQAQEEIIIANRFTATTSHLGDTKDGYSIQPTIPNSRAKFVCSLRILSCPNTKLVHIAPSMVAVSVAVRLLHSIGGWQGLP